MKQRALAFLPERDRRAVEAFVERVWQTHSERVQQIILYGSKARGDSHVQVVNLMQAKEGRMTSAAFFLAILSALVGRPVTPATVVLAEMTIHGMMQPITMLGECLQLARENGAKRVLLPASNARDLAAIPPDVLSNLDLAFFTDARDCALKGLAE